ncbi:MAG: hypothetical protein GX640_12460, partial [Fibrobacter sp.]|nr:hypothetical protein [Fibrobacter sp.]
MRILLLTFVIVEAFFFPAFADELDSISSDGLKTCISDYRNGFYSQVVDCINGVLPDLTSFNDSLKAYKVLALSFGMLNQVEMAKENF